MELDNRRLCRLLLALSLCISLGCGLSNGSCCGLDDPPMMFRPPPIPPGLDILKLNLPCPYPDPESTDPPFIEERIPQTESSTDGGKPLSVGMILGIVIAILFLLLLGLVGWILAKKKYIKDKYQIEPENDQEKQGNFLYNYRIRGWFWRSKSKKASKDPTGVPSKNWTKMFSGVRQSEPSISSTSSESGYCEEADNQDNLAAERDSSRVALRRKHPNLRSNPSRLASTNVATPDIIASTQGIEDDDDDDDDDNGPKRWSIFGTLPSLKPLRSIRGLQLSSAVQADSSPEASTHIIITNQEPGVGQSPRIRKVPREDREKPNIPPRPLHLPIEQGHRHPIQNRSQEQQRVPQAQPAEASPRRPHKDRRAPHKKSRVRIRSNEHSIEAEVEV